MEMNATRPARTGVHAGRVHAGRAPPLIRTGRGAYAPYNFILGTRTWVGTMYVQSTDLHVVMGPGHPDF